MEKAQNRDEILKLLFGQHPNEAGFHVTSDNQAFTDKHKGDALNHAKTLTDKKVDWVKNPKVKADAADDSIEDQAAERNALIDRYKELFGSEPAKNIKTETLKTKIAEKEAEEK